MSGLLERMVRRRRVSTSTPTSPAPIASSNGAAHANGAAPDFVKRGRMRRRARYLRQLREVQLRDIGGFVLELHRFGRQRPDVLAQKVTAAAATDAELRTLELALSQPAQREIREPGIGGACPACGALHGSADRFCAHCGHAIGSAKPQDAPR
jgi:hypothetical protein